MSANIFVDIDKVILRKMDKQTLIDQIKAGSYDLTKLNKDENTALMVACTLALADVALALIETYPSNVGHVNANGETALTLAIDGGLVNVALSLINAEKTVAFYVDPDGNTPLTLACSETLETVALALINTGLSIPKHKNESSENALEIASQEGLTRVIKALTKKPQIIIDITQSGFNPITQETRIIKDYLSEDIDENIAIKFASSYFLISKTDIETLLDNDAYIKYECKRAGDDVEFTEDSNIMYGMIFFSLSAIIGINGVVIKSELEDIIDEWSSNNLYEIVPTGKKLKSIISQDFIDGGSGEGADHCQTGKETDVYVIREAGTFIKKKRERGRGVEETKEETTLIETKEDEPTEVTQTINIMYKGNNYTCPIDDSTTIKTLKTIFLSMLISQGIIENDRFNVKFIYNGKVASNDDILLIELNPSTGSMVGQTMQAMLSPMTGGKKSKRRSKKSKRKSKKSRKIRNFKK